MSRKAQNIMVVSAAAGLFGLVAWVDYITGFEVSFSIFYVLPISLPAWFLGRSAGIAAALVGAVLWFVVDRVLSNHPYSSPLFPYWNAFVRLGFFLIVATLLARTRDLLRTLQNRTDQVAAAYVELDHLRREQLATKDQLLSNVSHELRTPLTAMHQFVTLVADGSAGPLAPTQRDYLGIALRNVDQLRRMIGDLLESTRAESGKLPFEVSDVDPGSVVEETIGMLHSQAAEKNLTLTWNLAPEVGKVRTDPGRLRQVLVNLLDNAVKFTPSGGRVEARVELAAEPGFARISVSDTGPGIPPKEVKQLFQRLYQVERQTDSDGRRGLGLGLFISREIVVRHGGRIWVESEVGRGSRFVFTVPLALAAAVEERAS